MKPLILSILALVLIGGAVLIILKNRKESSVPLNSQSPVASREARNKKQTESTANRVRGNLPVLPVNGTKIVISKTKRQLQLYSERKLLRTYRIGLGFSPVDDKIKEGDGATPEGTFYVFTKNTESSYYLSLGISYPNLENARRGLRDGLITSEQFDQIVAANLSRSMPPQDTPLGGQIYIHGNGSHKDWTLGCVALDDKDVLDLFDAVSVGTKVIINH